MEQFLMQIDEMERMRDQVSDTLEETKQCLSKEKKKYENVKKVFSSQEGKRNATEQQKVTLCKQRGELVLSTEKLKKEVKDLSLQYADRQAFQESLHKDGEKLSSKQLAAEKALKNHTSKSKHFIHSTAQFQRRTTLLQQKDDNNSKILELKRKIDEQGQTSLTLGESFSRLLGREEEISSCFREGCQKIEKINEEIKKMQSHKVAMEKKRAAEMEKELQLLQKEIEGIRSNMASLA